VRPEGKVHALLSFSRQSTRCTEILLAFRPSFVYLLIRNGSIQVLTILALTVGSFTSQHWLARLAGMALALMAGLSLMPVRAQASCGDYLRPMSPAAGHEVHDGNSPAGPHDLPATPGHKQPCSGPNCSPGSDYLPFAPAPSVSPTPEQWGEVATAPVLSAAGATFHTPGGLLCSPIHLCFPPEPPPRLDTSNLP
jgi:hypothetical protein